MQDIQVRDFFLLQKIRNADLSDENFTSTFGLKRTRGRRMFAYACLNELYRPSIEFGILLSHLEMIWVGLEYDGSARSRTGQKPQRIIGPEAAKFEHRCVRTDVLHDLMKDNLFLWFVVSSQP